MTRIDGNLLELKGRSCQAVARETLLAFCTTTSTRAAKPRCGCGCRNRASQTRCDVHKGGKFGCTPSREARYLLDLLETFPRRTQCQRENGPGKRLRRFCLSGRWRFFGSSERPPVSEDPKIDQVAQWRWRFFGSRGKKTTGGSDLNAFPPSDGLTKRRKCSSAAAASSGLAPVQDRANVVKAARRQRAFTWLFGLFHSKACLCICARLIMRHLGWHQILFISLLVDRSCAAYCPDFTYSQAAPRALPAALGVVHAPSRRFVLQTCHSCAERKRSRRLGFGSARLDSKFRRANLTSHVAGPHSDLPASSSRSHQIVTATSSE